MRMDLIGMKRKQAKPLNMKVLQQQAKERKLDRRRQIDEARESGVVLATSILRKQEKERRETEILASSLNRWANKQSMEYYFQRETSPKFLKEKSNNTLSKNN